MVLSIGMSTPLRAAQSGADDRLRQGIQALQQARFGDSRKLLEEAALASTDPSQLARIYVYLGLNASIEGKSEQTRQALAKALSHAPSLALSPEEFRPDFIRTFERVKQQVTSVIEVTATAAGATVSIDRKKVGVAPIAARVNPGSHRIEVRGTTGRSFTTSVRVAAGSTVHVVGRPLPPKMKQSPPPPLVNKADQPPRPRSRLWTWVAGASSVVALGVALGFGISAGQDYDEWEASSCATDASSRCSTLDDRITDKDLTANILLGTAGALAVTSVVLFFVEGRTPGPGSPARTNQRPRASLSIGSISLQIPF